MQSPFQQKGWMARLFPSSDGTKDAPLDARSNHFFWVLATGVVIVGVVLLLLALVGR
jgi:hypothetical protein